MIPKRIFYCWFGRGELPAKAIRCINSWKKYCPDYEIVCVSEDNFDVNLHPYTKYHYSQKHYAHVSDYARLFFPCNYGGVYFDIDVELIKPIDEYMQYQAFYAHCYSSFSSDPDYVSTGQGFGTEANHPIVKAMLEEYDKVLPLEDGSYEMITAGILNTNVIRRFGISKDGRRENICGAEILPEDYTDPFNDLTGVMKKTKNTFSIHWRTKTWIPKGLVIRSIIMRPIHRVLGEDFFHKNKS